MHPIFVLPLLLAGLTIASCGAPTTSSAPVEEAATTEGAAPTDAAPSDAEAAEATPTESAETVETVAAASPESTTLAAVYVQDAVAIAGADPVAYFTEGAYVPGSTEFTYEWSGATWQFASAENRDTFASNPAQYAPQYGGFCAWAVSQGYTAAIDPTAWTIVDDKLYLNYDANIQSRWERDIPGNIAKADANWPAVAQ
ncbi:YHS domain-containing (seleno)protein [Leptolyngbya iicbica]|uniref:YHS domain-containing protein n=2 Tax=Cyanophyceae TaxID=3028117 RepID=A0A4Q7E2S8_9CYAN|nr:YHS domain-containing (seleno)protein [Leptolyngbya sp. LK]RZM76092.1 YHS domain-containing protein [Leptolyngbya sp. LK]